MAYFFNPCNPCCAQPAPLATVFRLDGPYGSIATLTGLDTDLNAIWTFPCKNFWMQIGAGDVIYLTNASSTLSQVDYDGNELSTEGPVGYTPANVRTDQNGFVSYSLLAGASTWSGIERRKFGVGTSGTVLDAKLGTHKAAVDLSGNFYAWDEAVTPLRAMLRKYDSTGTEVLIGWPFTYTGQQAGVNDFPNLAVDSSDNLYLYDETANSLTSYLVKLTSAGAETYRKDISVTYGRVLFIALDTSNNVYLGRTGSLESWSSASPPTLRWRDSSHTVYCGIAIDSANGWLYNARKDGSLTKRLTSNGSILATYVSGGGGASIPDVECAPGRYPFFQ